MIGIESGGVTTAPENDIYGQGPQFAVAPSSVDIWSADFADLNDLMSEVLRNAAADGMIALRLEQVVAQDGTTVEAIVGLQFSDGITQRDLEPRLIDALEAAYTDDSMLAAILYGLGIEVPSERASRAAEVYQTYSTAPGARTEAKRRLSMTDTILIPGLGSLSVELSSFQLWIMALI